ncbi:MAG: Glutathione-specific gamma-glutamylcyclotransferase [Candidatus Erwinia impunctatus]
MGILTREFLRQADCKTAFGAIDEALLWSQEQRTNSLKATLGRRPDNSAVWVFGYGSLMWNPVFEAAEQAEGVLTGWHRTFCLRLTADRATDCNPGRMLGLEAGGDTQGVAFRLPEATLEQDLDLLWKREMLTGCYLPTWCDLKLKDGRDVTALVFIVNVHHAFYEAEIEPQVIAPLIVGASGPLGSNVEYLFALEKTLTERGVVDNTLNELLACVRRILKCPGSVIAD